MSSDTDGPVEHHEESDVEKTSTISVRGIDVDTEEMSTDDVAAASNRLADAGLATRIEDDTTCCYAVQDKVWVTGPANEKWEVYTVLADSDTFGTSPKLLEQNATEDAEQGSVCCGGNAADQAEARTACC